MRACFDTAGESPLPRQATLSTRAASLAGLDLELRAPQQFARVCRSRPLETSQALAQARDPLQEQLDEGAAVDPNSDIGVRLVLRPAPQVDDRPATAELRRAVDLDMAVFGLDEIGTEDVREGHGVVDG